MSHSFEDFDPGQSGATKPWCKHLNYEQIDTPRGRTTIVTLEAENMDPAGRMKVVFASDQEGDTTAIGVYYPAIGMMFKLDAQQANHLLGFMSQALFKTAFKEAILEAETKGVGVDRPTDVPSFGSLDDNPPAELPPWHPDR